MAPRSASTRTRSLDAALDEDSARAAHGTSRQIRDVVSPLSRTRVRHAAGHDVSARGRSASCCTTLYDGTDTPGCAGGRSSIPGLSVGQPRVEGRRTRERPPRHHQPAVPRSRGGLMPTLAEWIRPPLRILLVACPRRLCAASPRPVCSLSSFLWPRYPRCRLCCGVRRRSSRLRHPTRQRRGWGRLSGSSGRHWRVIFAAATGRENYPS